MLVYIIIVLVYRCKDRLFSGWLSPVYLVDIVIYVCWQRKFVIFGQLSRISFVRNFSAGRLPRFVKRTAKPTAGNLRYSAKTVRRVQTVSRARRKAKSAGTGNPQGTGAGRSNLGVVVGVAACRHSGGVYIPQGAVRKGGH